jgi:DNA polymerase elongation subunit (family B)
MTDEISVGKTVKKVVKMKNFTQSFRLMDFHIYDEKSADDDDAATPTYGKTPYQKTDNLQFIIQMFGVNETGETCCIYITDFKPFFYVKVGDLWQQSHVALLLKEIRDNIDERFRASILDAELVEYNKLYGFSAGKQNKFVKFTFKNTTAMNKVKSLWYEYITLKNGNTERKSKRFIFKGVKLELYESNIPPLLRYFHIHNISPSGWVSIQSSRCKSSSIKTTTCTYEFICNIEQITPMVDKEERVPYKICSFDIEASSSHGDFPIPVKTYKRLATNIVDVFIKHRQQLDANKSKTLLDKTILTAFEYDRFEDIDIVYPKIKPSKEKVKYLTKILIEESMEKAKKANTDEDNSELLTIDTMFERIKELQQQGGSGEDGGDGDEEDENEGLVQESSYPNYNKKEKKIKTEKNATVIDILLSENYERDEKIQITNEVLTRLFPRLEGDKVTFIGSTFMRYGEPETYLNHCVVLGSCDPVDGAVIESVDDENDLLMKWTELIQKENPDIIIGYNIFGFDYEFMFRRAQENHCEKEFLLLSRKHGELCGKLNKEGQVEIENTKMAIASGEYDLRFFKMTGRLQIDMYAYLRRDFNLGSYKLDDVAAQFISDDVKKFIHAYDSNHGEVTELFSQNLTGLHIGDYIHIELTGFTADYYKDGKKFKVLNIERNREVTENYKGKEVTNKYNVITIEGHEDFDKTKSIKWGTAKDDVTPQDIFRLANGDARDRAVVAKYCIQDCNLVHHLMNKIDVLTGYVEMARICSVPISFLVFRGQGIKLTSYVAKKCREKNTLMPDLEKFDTGEGYEGAIVLPPKCSMYMDNPVACVDYSSLYPSSMISQNLSHDSKVWTKEYNLQGELIKITGETDTSGNFIYDNLPEYEYIDLEFDTYRYIRKTPTSRAEKTKCGKMICRWAQFPHDKKGIMPSILEELLKARSDTRKMIKTEKDPFMQNILDKRQLGYKVTANSLYGQCGSRTSTFYEKDVAASTTATGRMMIIYAKRIIEEVYGDRVYETAMHGPVKCNAEYIYGDSVANYTPIYVRNTYNGRVSIFNIQDLANVYGNNNWVMCKEKGKQDKEFCELQHIETWTENGWTKLHRVIRHTLAPHKKMLRILTDSAVLDVTDDHSLLRPDGTEVSPNAINIGTELLHFQNPFMNDIDGSFKNSKTAFENTKEIKFDMTKEACFVAECYVYAKQNGYNISILPTSKKEIFILKITDKPIENQSKLKQYYEIPYEGYVYDLTTENHHFAAGIGNMIVHNTDSVFFTFNLQNPVTGEKIRGKPALEMTIEIAQDAAKLCSEWLKPPMELSYEKTLMPFILLSKKRYVGMLYEEDPNKGKLKYMGLSLKRRDSCDYLKDVYGGILNILMKENDIKKATAFLNHSLLELIEGHVSMDKLAITKALRSDYKNPHQIGHKVLADRIGQRDPGNKPKPGDRMKFVFVVNNTPKALMGDKIETPEYIIENKLPIDYTHYITNQLMKPLQQLFGLALEVMWETESTTTALRQLQAYKKEITKIQNNYPDMEEFMKKKEKYCSTRVKALLFDDILTRIYNEKNKIRTLNAFFQPKK